MEALEAIIRLRKAVKEGEHLLQVRDNAATHCEVRIDRETLTVLVEAARKPLETLDAYLAHQVPV